MVSSVSLAGGIDTHLDDPVISEKANKAPSFLFVVDAKQGEIKQDKQGHFHLV